MKRYPKWVSLSRKGSHARRKRAAYRKAIAREQAAIDHAANKIDESVFDIDAPLP